MSIECVETEYGFRWGVAEVLRYASMPDGSICIGVEANGKHRLDIYVSKTGRSVRVFERGYGELTRKSAASPVDASLPLGVQPW